MPRVKFSGNARSDLLEIRDYIAQFNPNASLRYTAKLRRKCNMLGKHPGLGERCDDISPGSRRTFVGNYVIFYKHVGANLEILRIMRGERDIDSLE